MSFTKPVDGIGFESTREGFLFALSRRESSSNLILPDNVMPNVRAQKIHNRSETEGFIGYFQFGEAALYDAGYFIVPYEYSSRASSDFQRALVVQDWLGSWTGKDGVTSKDIFLNGRRHQLNAINILVNRHCSALRNQNVNEFYGKIVNGVEITESGCIAGCHLKGARHVLDFVRGAANAADAFGTKVGEYIELLAHYDLESCCNRKIYINVVKNNQPATNIEVQVESEYREGKYFNEIGIIENKYITDEQGKIPVIIRHPDARIKIIINNKSMEIVQETHRKQSYTIDLMDYISVRASLEQPSMPQPKPESDQTPQEARNQQNASQAEQQETILTKDVRFNVQVVEGDSGKAISNMRFYLTYKGNIKEHRSDSAGIKQGIIAESGQDIEVAVAGNGAHQVVHHFTVQSHMDGQTIKIPLPVHSFRLRIVNESQQAVTNSTFMIFYRGRSVAKKTDSQGIISLNMLTGFVYGFGLINGKKLVHVRCVKSIVEQKISINSAAQRASVLLDQLSRAKPLPKPLSSVTQPKPANTTQAVPNAEKQSPTVQQDNSHTQTRGNPITTVSSNAPPSSDTTRYHIYHDGTIKRENKVATGYAEFIYYDQNGGKHNLGKSAYIVAPKRGRGNVIIDGNVYLIDQRRHTQYRNGRVNYKWTIQSDSHRFYLNGVTMSAVLGALIDYGEEEFVGSGFSTVDARSARPSTSHINGEAGDFRYLGKNGAHRINPVWTSYPSFDMTANTRFVNSFKKFGFRAFLTGTKAKGGVAKVAGTTYWDGHHHHLHIGNHSYDIEDI